MCTKSKTKIETNLVFTKVRNEWTCQFVNVTNWKRLSQLQTSWSFTLVNFLLPNLPTYIRIPIPLAIPWSSTISLRQTPSYTSNPFLLLFPFHFTNKLQESSCYNFYFNHCVLYYYTSCKSNKRPLLELKSTLLKV